MRGPRPILGRMEITRSRRRALSTILALVLAIESVSAVAAAAQVGAARDAVPVHRTPAAAMAPAPAVADGRFVAPVPRSVAPGRIRTVSPADPPAASPAQATAHPSPDKHRTHSAGVAKPAAPAIHHRRHASPARAPGHRSPAASPSYSGRNHLWIPSLGVNRSIAWFACSRSREPDNYVYRWGCAGSNNVYLLGHAWGVFKPLHDAYTSGRLRVGMRAIYADANGRVRTYAVRWWKLVRPTTSASWAWASLSSPSMTLQTCVGARSQYRLMVRLVQVRG